MATNSTTEESMDIEEKEPKSFGVTYQAFAMKIGSFV